MKTLYFAPINLLGNYVFRHLLLNHGVDYVFSELIMVKDIDKEIKNGKLRCFSEDIPKTIFQIGASTAEDIKKGVEILCRDIPSIKEININMGCPHSTFIKEKVCGGVLTDLAVMKEVSTALVESCSPLGIIPSTKIRLGESIKRLAVREYLSLMQKVGIKKIYIHARPLGYPYEKPAIYNPLRSLKELFPNLELIFNGDIDSSIKYKEMAEIPCDGIMVGRAALTNPLIFHQIKNEISAFESKHYNPFLKDPNVIRKGGKTIITREKYDVIKEYVDLAVQEKLRLRLVRNNLKDMTKGISEIKFFLKKINQAEFLSQIQEHLKVLEDFIV